MKLKEGAKETVAKKTSLKNTEKCLKKKKKKEWPHLKKEKKKKKDEI